MKARTERAVDRLLAAFGIRRIPAAEALARFEEAIGRAGMITIHDLSTDTRRPRMDLDALIARWRRHASHVENHAGRLTPAEVYEICADQLEAVLNSAELQKRGKETVVS